MNNKSDTNENTSRPPAPAKRSGVLSVALICATILVVVYWLKPARNTQPLRRLWTPLVVNTDGKELITPDSLRLEFWTPSSKTKDFLSKTSGTNSWEILESEDRVIQFGNVLRSDPAILGYRRTEVWGQGRTVLKPGWWWSVTVRTNYTVPDLARTYRSYWKVPSSIFVEIIDNRGHNVEP